MRGPVQGDRGQARSLALSAARQHPLDQPPPRETRFGSPLEHVRVHWVQPEVVAEVTYLTWTEGGLLRAVSYQGQREDKRATQVVRSPIGSPATKSRSLA